MNMTNGIIDALSTMIKLIINTIEAIANTVLIIVFFIFLSSQSKVFLNVYPDLRPFWRIADYDVILHASADLGSEIALPRRGQGGIDVLA